MQFIVASESNEDRLFMGLIRIMNNVNNNNNIINNNNSISLFLHAVFADNEVLYPVPFTTTPYFNLTVGICQM
jgi:hypothetical protein